MLTLCLFAYIFRDSYTLLSELHPANYWLDIVKGVMQSIATGSLIYVTFFESRGNQPHNSNEIQSLFRCVRFCCHGST